MIPAHKQKQWKIRLFVGYLVQSNSLSRARNKGSLHTSSFHQRRMCRFFLFKNKCHSYKGPLILGDWASECGYRLSNWIFGDGNSGVFPKWIRNSENSAISGNLIYINHWSMKCSQFKDPVSHVRLAGAVVASWFLTQEVAGFNNLLKT